MKKINTVICFLLIILYLTSQSAIFAQEVNPGYLTTSYYWVAVYATEGQGLALKESPDLNSARKDRIPEGTELIIDRVSGSWGFTSYNGMYGWVYLKYTKIIGQYPTERPSWGYITPAYYTVYNTQGEGLELRCYPTSDSSTFGPLMDGTVVLIEAVQDSWAYTSYEGNYGWSHMNYLRPASDWEIENARAAEQEQEITKPLEPETTQLWEPEIIQQTELKTDIVEDTWTCSNGHEGNTDAFCPKCGEARPEEIVVGNEEQDNEITDELLSYDFVKPEDLIMYLAESDFYTGEQVSLFCTFLYGESIYDKIQVVDENQVVIAEVENDGSGYATCQIPLSTAESKVLKLHAQSGSYTSTEVKVYIHPPVTQEMMITLEEVSTDLGEHVLSCNYEDPSGEKALEEVVSWLMQDMRVADVQRFDDVILYVTQDGLTGSYNMGYHEEDGTVFGSIGSGIDRYETAEDAYTLEKKGEDLSQVFIESDKVMTNTDIKVVIPSCNVEFPEAYIGYFTYEILTCLLKNYETVLGSHVQYLLENDGKNALLEGDITDCGMLFLAAHGGGIEFRESYFLTLNLGATASESIVEKFVKYRDDFWIINKSNEDHNYDYDTTRAVYNISIQENNDGSCCLIRSINLTVNYIEQVLADRIFDNTVVFLLVCNGLKNSVLKDLLLAHGASAVIGCEDNLDMVYSLMCVEEMTQTLLYRKEGNLGRSLWSFLDNVNEDTIPIIVDYVTTCKDSEFLIQIYLESDPSLTKEEIAAFSYEQIPEIVRQEMNNDYNTVQNQNWYLKIYPNPSLLRLCGEVVVSGTVMSNAGTAPGIPLQDVKVTAYRWLNHGFQLVAEAQTDSNGAYVFAELPVGLYVIEAEKDDLWSKKPATTILEITAPEERCGPIYLGYSLQGNVTDAKTGENLDGTIVSFSDSNGHTVSVITDSNGTWDCIVGEQEYQINFEHEGYYSVQEQIRNGNGNGISNVALIPKDSGMQISNVICGTTANDDMWDLYLYLIDPQQHLILEPDGTAASLKLNPPNDIFEGVYGGVNSEGNLKVWQLDASTIRVEAYYRWKNLTIKQIYRVNSDGYLMELSSADSGEETLLLSSDFLYDRFTTKTKVFDKYYMPAQTPVTQVWPAKKLLEELSGIFPSPELSETYMEQSDDGTVIYTRETYTSGGVDLTIQSDSSGRIMEVYISDENIYSNPEYEVYGSLSAFSVSNIMRQLYRGIILSDQVEISADRNVLAAFDFDAYAVYDNYRGDNFLGNVRENSTVYGNVQVEYRKETHIIPTTTFDSSVTIRFDGLLTAY